MPRYLSGIDVDTDALADALRRLADGIDDRAVNLTYASTDHRAHVDDPSEFGFTIECVATHGYEDVVDIIRYATKGYLRFGDEWVRPVLAGDHRATLRYGFEREFDVGDEVDLIDEFDDKFGEATVEAIFEMAIEDVVEMGIAEWSHSTVDEVVDTLRGHYGGADIQPGTVVTVVLLGDVEKNDEYDFSKLNDGVDNE